MGCFKKLTVSSIGKERPVWHCLITLNTIELQCFQSGDDKPGNERWRSRLTEPVYKMAFSCIHFWCVLLVCTKRSIDLLFGCGLASGKGSLVTAKSIQRPTPFNSCVQFDRSIWWIALTGVQLVAQLSESHTQFRRTHHEWPAAAADCLNLVFFLLSGFVGK